VIRSFRDFKQKLKLFLLDHPFYLLNEVFIQGDTKKRELLKTPTKIEEIQQKNFIDRN